MPRLSDLDIAPSAAGSNDTFVGVRVNNDGSKDDYRFRLSQLPQGPTGPMGPQGPRGPQGVPGPTGAQGPVGPAGLNWRGSWLAGTSYSVNDVVAYSGASYFCTAATSGSTAPNSDTSHWALLASQGATGPTGPAGPTGATGPTGPQGPQGIQGPKGNTGDTGSKGDKGDPGTDAAPHSLLVVLGNGSRITAMGIEPSSLATGYAVNDTFNILGGPGGVATGGIGRVDAVTNIGDGAQYLNSQVGSSGANAGKVVAVAISMTSTGYTYQAGVVYQTALAFGGSGSGCTVRVTAVDGSGTPTAVTVVNKGSGYIPGSFPALVILPVSKPTAISIVSAGTLYSIANNYYTTNIIGSGSGLVISVTSISAANGPIITDDFFNNTIIQISCGNSIYLVNSDFTQSGTTITSINPALVFSQYGTQIIAWA